MECCTTLRRWSEGWLVVMPFQIIERLDLNSEKELHFWAPAQ